MRSLQTGLFCMAILLGAQSAFAQVGTRSAGSGDRSGRAAHSSGQSTAPGATSTATGNFGFPARLGSTVGITPAPGMVFPPGVGNINHPGVAPSIQPSPAMQPLPNGIPNINFPGGIPVPSHVPGSGNYGRDGRRYPGRNGAGSGTVIYYGVPYYVPYYVYPSDTAEVPPAAAPTPVAPAPYPPENVQPGTPSFPPPLPSAGVSSVELAPPENGNSVQPERGNPVTLLAMKDHTILAVTDYWLEGEWLYYQTDQGMHASIPLSQLDFSFTQQLNRERNVRFVLESR